MTIIKEVGFNLNKQGPVSSGYKSVKMIQKDILTFLVGSFKSEKEAMYYQDSVYTE